MSYCLKYCVLKPLLLHEPEKNTTLCSGASPTRRDLGRGFTAAQWSHYCGRHICAESIEKFVRTALPAGHSASQGSISATFHTGSGGGSAKISRQSKEKKNKNKRQVNCDILLYLFVGESISKNEIG